ncbi:MAG: HDOD domain-containing protein [Gammaproteobacteria bacterium]|nr:HDOD domain-containing protein [Gammaproteobacteria bacterium]MDH5778451.1 HDOD domain-containing protein [Gammaproteobacteria bacterium]
MQQSMEDWINGIGDKPIPVMQHTIMELTKLCKGNDIPMHDIVELVETDPGLTVQLIRTCTTTSKSSLRAEVTSAQQAAMMLGIEKVKQLPNTLPSVDKSLAPSNRHHLQSVFSRAYHAARQAKHWAEMRRDMMPDEVFAAAMLHFIGEMVIAMNAPDELDRIMRMRNEEHIASEEAQYIVLGFTFDQLSLEIAKKWQLPSLAIDSLHAENAQQPRAYSIMLAVQLARHAAYDWYSPKMLKLQEEAAEWLGQATIALIRDTHHFAVEIARDSHFYGVHPAAAMLLVDPRDHESESTDETQEHAGICLIPQLTIMRETIQKLKALPTEEHDLGDIIAPTLKGLHDGVGLNRTVFALFNPNKKSLNAFQIVGADNNPEFGQFQVSLEQDNLFTILAKKSQAVAIGDDNRDKLWPLLPDEFQNIIKTDSFYLMSVYLHAKFFGVFYADRHTSDCQLDPISYKFFKAICKQSEQTLQRISDIRIK